MSIDGGTGKDTLLGTTGADEINGNGGADILFGFGGKDTLNGGAGADILFGGAGADALNGDGGDDYIEGGAGADVISGGAGDDILSGGAGNDTFVFAQKFGGDLVVDFAAGDIIDLKAFTGITSLSQLNFFELGGNVVVTVPGTNGGSIVVQGATLAAVQNAIQVACLLRGTMVRTPAGEVPVETLAIGDLVLTVDGAAKPIKWIGRRAYARAFVEKNDRIAPVVFSAGSLGEALPVRDLAVSPEHAVLIGDVLVAAKHLVNGSSIRQDARFETIEYFHVEFESAEVILTNGLATESYVDHGNRRMFSNYAEYVDLYGDAPAGDGKRRFDVVSGGEALEAIRSRIDAGMAKVA